MSALITSKQLNKVCVLCSAIGPEGFLFDWFGDIQPKIVRLNLRLGQTLFVDYEELLKELKLETTFAVFMFSWSVLINWLFDQWEIKKKRRT